MPYGGKKSSIDPLIIQLVLSGRSVPDIAAEIGVSESTVFRRLRNPAIKKQIEQLRSEVMGQIVNALTNVAVKAVRRLEDLIDNANAESVKLNACRTVLEMTGKLNEQFSLKQEIELLKAKVENGRQPIKLGTEQTGKACSTSGHGRHNGSGRATPGPGVHPLDVRTAGGPVAGESPFDMLQETPPLLP